VSREKVTVTATVDGQTVIRSAELHGSRVSIKRETVDEEGNPVMREVHFVRGGATVRDLDNLAFWWLDRYAEAEPSTLFSAVMAANGQLTRVRIPKECVPIPLPESTKAYDDACRPAYVARLQRHADKRERDAFAEYDAVMARFHAVMAECPSYS
jgi:hypothetical protein